MQGKLIAIEGLDRCGKDTQLKILQNKIPNSIIINFPNENIKSGLKLRDYLNQKISLTDKEANDLFALNRRETIP